MKKHNHLHIGCFLGILLLILLFTVGIWILYQRKSGMSFVRQMGMGINIGNSLDSYKLKEISPDASVEEYETYWGNPVITKKLFEEIKRAGFGTVRIPVSWGEHMDDNYNVDAEWMKRVTEVVDDALDSDLYVILDIHHEKWLVPTEEKEEQVTEILCTLWKQIAVNFAGKGEKLLFEAMNEPRVEGTKYEWTSGTTEYREVVNRLNKAFVETVRNTGGNNRKRWLLLPAYGSTRRESALKALKLPVDFRLIVSVHAYIPYKFTLGEECYNNWDEEEREDTKEIEQMAERLDRLFLKKDIPVIITEFGCHDKNNKEDMLAWANYYTDMAKEKKIPYIWWDNGKDSRLIDRQSYAWVRPELAELLAEP